HHLDPAAAGEGDSDRAAISPQGRGRPPDRPRPAVSAAADTPRRRGSVIAFAVFALAAFISFIALGTWQLQRKAWKEALISTLDERLAARPTPLSVRERWASLDPATDEFRRVFLRAEF